MRDIVRVKFESQSHVSHSACKSVESFSVFSITREHTEFLIRSPGRLIVSLNETVDDRMSGWMQRSVAE